MQYIAMYHPTRSSFMDRWLTVVLVAVSLVSPAGADGPKERWIGDVDSALAEARKRNKPVFLTFRCER
jgi:hypothetical protein